MNTFQKLKTVTACVVLLLALQAPAQESSNRLSFEFGLGVNGYAMDALNKHYIDNYAATPQWDLIHDHISSGQHYRLGVLYKPKGLFDIGVYGSYQYGNSTHRPTITAHDHMGSPSGVVEGSAELRTEALVVGISTTWYLSHVLGFEQKENALKRLQLGVELNGGIGFSRASLDIRYFEQPAFSYYDYLNSRHDFQGEAGLKVNYDLTQSPLFTSLGLRFGYQYFQTRTLQDRQGNDWSVRGQNAVNLDFSGLYFGIFAGIGK